MINLAREARRVTGLSQEKFAKTFRIPVGNVRNHEQGVYKPPEGLEMYYRLIKTYPEKMRQMVESLPKEE